jgi:hypothetical protein
MAASMISFKNNMMGVWFKDSFRRFVEVEVFREQTGVDLNFGDGIEVVILQSQKRKWLSDKYLGVNARAILRCMEG